MCACAVAARLDGWRRWRRGALGARRGRGARGATGRVPRLHPARAGAVQARRARPRPVPRAGTRRRHHQPTGLRPLRLARWTR